MASAKPEFGTCQTLPWPSRDLAAANLSTRASNWKFEGPLQAMIRMGQTSSTDLERYRCPWPDEARHPFPQNATTRCNIMAGSGSSHPLYGKNCCDAMARNTPYYYIYIYTIYIYFVTMYLILKCSIVVHSNILGMVRTTMPYETLEHFFSRATLSRIMFKYILA